MKNIVIVAYHFYPENTPRAFRTFELAKGFAKKGYNVNVFIPKYDYNYNELEKRYNFSIFKVKTGFLFNRNAKKYRANTDSLKKKKKFSFFIKIIKWLYFGQRSFEYSLFLLRALIKNIKEKQSIILSISLPVSTLLSAYLFYIFKKSKISMLIADYGDPYSGNISLNVPRWQTWLEKKILKKVTFITIPIESAKKMYEKIIDSKKIKIIPQGFDFSEIKTQNYQKNIIPTFAYAGIFYEDIRNPELIFDYLLTLDVDYKLIVYTMKGNVYGQYLFDKYKLLFKDKIEFIYNMPRLDLIYELSTMDFLLNVENLSSNQSPSKLVDYSLAKRPILSLNPTLFDKKIIDSFIIGDYISQINIDIDRYNIKKVVMDFDHLFN